jgi:hypothetical protein
MSRNLKDFEELHSPMFRSDRPLTKFGEHRKFPKTCKRFIVTAAQNGTPVNDTWWASYT